MADLKSNVQIEHLILRFNSIEFLLMNGHPALLVWIVLPLCMTTAVHSADRMRVVNEGGIRDQWMLADGMKLIAPGYPAAFAERGDNVCVAVGYAIQPDGTTSDFTLLKAWNSSTGSKEPVEGFYDAFAQAGATALLQWKFKPRPEVSNPKTNFTVATMHFIGKEAVDVGSLRAHCDIAHLAVLMKNRNVMTEVPAQSRLRRDIDRGLRHIQGTQSLIEDPARAAGSPVY